MKMESKMARYKDGKLINSKSCSLRFLFIKVFQEGNDEKEKVTKATPSTLWVKEC